MIRLLVRRLLSAIPLLLALSFLVFVMLNLMAGDAARVVAGDDATPEQIEETRQRLNLDDSLLERYFSFLGGAIHGDLGTSLLSSDSVSGLIFDRLPVTLSLTLVTILLSIAIGIPSGMAAALRPNTLVDRLVSVVSSLFMAIPPFVVGLVLVIVFAINFSVLPATGYVTIGEGGVGGWIKSLLLPAIALAAVSSAELTRQTRASMIDTLEKDFIRTARAKGLRAPVIIGKHALKNSGVPIVTILGLQGGRILAGAVTVETVFALPGFGSLAVNAVSNRDVPVILGVVMVSAVMVLIINLIVDISYGYFNPKLRS